MKTGNLEDRIRKEMFKYSEIYECIEEDKVEFSMFCYTLKCFNKKHFEIGISLYSDYKLIKEGTIKGKIEKELDKITVYINKDEKIDDILNLNSYVSKLLFNLICEYCSNNISLDNFKRRFLIVLNYAIKNYDISNLLERLVLPSFESKIKIIIKDEKRPSEKIKGIPYYI
ncbi:MAG: hypothetical protein QXV63_02385 [Candidatus Aenigmatarchaeota archaeon]